MGDKSVRGRSCTPVMVRRHETASTASSSSDEIVIDEMAERKERIARRCLKRAEMFIRLHSQKELLERRRVLLRPVPEFALETDQILADDESSEDDDCSVSDGIDSDEEYEDQEIGSIIPDDMYCKMNNKWSKRMRSLAIVRNGKPSKKVKTFVSTRRLTGVLEEILAVRTGNYYLID